MVVMWDQLSWMKPIPLQAIIIERGKQWGFAPLIFPEAFAPGHLSVKYPYFKDATGMPAKETRPGSPGDISEATYEEKTVTGKEYRIPVYIDDWLAKWSNIDMAKRKLNLAVDKIMRRREERVFTHLGNNTLYDTMGFEDKTANGWDDATMETRMTNILNDLTKMIEWVKTHGFIVPDTLIIGTDAEKAMLACKPLMEVIYWSGQGSILGEGLTKPTQPQSLTGARLLGLDIGICHSTYQSVADATETALVKDVAWVLKRGLDTGCIHTSERLTTEIEGRVDRSQKVNVFSTFEAHIMQPLNIFYMKDIMGPTA